MKHLQIFKLQQQVLSLVMCQLIATFPRLITSQNQAGGEVNPTAAAEQTELPRHGGSGIPASDVGVYFQQSLAYVSGVWLPRQKCCCQLAIGPLLQPLFFIWNVFLFFSNAPQVPRPATRPSKVGQKACNWLYVLFTVSNISHT